MLSEIRYALKTLRQNPGFALTAILSIALAIGANSTIFSFADGLLLRPLPLPNPSEVVTLRSLPPSVSSLPLRGTGEMSYPDFVDFSRSNRSFEGLAGYSQVIASLSKAPGGPTPFILGYEVTADFFRVLGIEPPLGRSFRPEEDEVEGRDAVVVLSHDLWVTEFAHDPTVIGRSLRLNGVEFIVVGVAPESFDSMDQFVRPQFFIPDAMGRTLYPEGGGHRTDRGGRGLVVKGRLKPGVSIRSAAKEASALAKSLEDTYPTTNRGFGATVNTEVEMRLINMPLLGALVAALFTVAVVILMIACANVANLMLGRGRVRAREIGIRLAIGAGRSRVVRLLLVESLVIAALGGVVALLVSQFTVGILTTMEVPADVPVYLHFQVDTRVVWFTAIASVVSALLFGLVPAIQSTRADVYTVIKSGESEGRRKRIVGRYALVVVQIAGSIFLLVATTESRWNFNNILAGNPGFRRDHRMTIQFNPAGNGYNDEQTNRFYETVVQRALDVNGVKSAALTATLPMTFNFETQSVVPESYDFPPGQENVEILAYIVDYHYFDTMGVPVLSGRGFLATDRANSPRVAVVNEAFAKQYLGSNPIGKKLRLDDRNGPSVEVVGVAMTGKAFSLVEPPVQAIYLPLTQNHRSRMTLVAETTRDPAAMAGPLQDMVRTIDPNIAMFHVRTLENLFEGSSVNTIRVVRKIYDSAAVLGLVLALVGLYAVVSYQVTRRTREIGIRMALGAEQREVVRIFLKQAGIISIIGISLGLVLSYLAGRALAASLGAPPPYPLLVAGVALSMFLTTIGASLIPAARAARTDPQKALRQD